ncbi:hypothetical protein [Labrys wisconsinensis]|uniref:Uncharacterized protein n=1 Tax=Labrys wisconsinensis TaxID=425677 RepID=A0ABU0J151_9HYPH|nr:hypothetical protein [Labrys wisconsinensis]MDQ0467993.1 hypothetical protein [Labrys wisconsinensis]
MAGLLLISAGIVAWRSYGIPEDWNEAVLRGSTASAIHARLGAPSIGDLGTKGFEEWHLDLFPYWILVVRYDRRDGAATPSSGSEAGLDDHVASSAHLLRVHDLFGDRYLERYALWGAS